VIALVELPADDVVAAQARGREIALYRLSDDVYATDNVCTHGNARLCDGFPDGHEIECPLHQCRFDVRNGRAMCVPVNEDIVTFAVKVESGDAFVEL
jgi:naphthalene 1,2-dioxygenase ferredoxin component